MPAAARGARLLPNKPRPILSCCVGQIELRMAITSCARGMARMKAIPQPPSADIDEIVDGARVVVATGSAGAGQDYARVLMTDRLTDR
jgi:hypothetical protein